MANTTEVVKSFWFCVSNDYRSGRSICTYTNPPKDEDEYNDNEENLEINDEFECNTPEEASEIEFALPSFGKQRIYIANEYPEYASMWYKDVNTNENTEQIYLKLFSQIHDCLPFRVTGYNCAYKEEGEYPEVPDDIKKLPRIITNKLVKQISEDDGYYFMFVVDSTGNEIMTHLLNPI